MPKFRKKPSGTAITSCVRDITSANKAPGGFGYGEDKRFNSWDDNDGSKLESYLDSLLDGTDKIIRFTGLSDYPSNILSGNGGWADIVLCNNGSIFVEWCGPTYITAGTSIGMQKAYKKRLVDGTWLPWEYDNPPMIPGEEYRTTERYLGKPVYVKTVDFGALPNASNKFVGIESGASIIRVSALASNGKTLPGSIGASQREQVLCMGSSNSVEIITYADASSLTATVTAWYTKTAD